MLRASLSIMVITLVFDEVVEVAAEVFIVAVLVVLVQVVVVELVKGSRSNSIGGGSSTEMTQITSIWSRGTR